ncbi:glycoside hydrolase family 3 C-terminal domain-containing protein [Pedococcus aerophilus]|uniref:Glycoside hydrolase family 3 C-terminal domain-containing protein n=2 Tax=Pedococcus aerophilus TaxID=436356 RepID=A0ABN3UTF2_9MICO
MTSMTATTDRPTASAATPGEAPAGRDHAAYLELVGRLDLATKVRLLTGATSFTLHGEESIGLAPMAFSDGPTGVRGLKFTGGDHVALFPSATVLASAWSEETAHEVGEMLAEEAERQQIHVVLGPTINLHRTPLGGRLFEAYSEDPLLTGKLAAAYVRGLQGRGIGACLKHLVANESETLRNYMNSVVSETALREVYLLPFEIAVQDADAWSIMAAYNDINGVAATEQNHVNNTVVKGDWGWDGLLMSDWFATKTSAPAALGGLDLVMPGPDGPWGEALVADVESGAVHESVIDEHVVRLLRLAERVGALGSTDEQRVWPTESLAPDAPARRAQLRRLATDGMVVLKNAGGILPLAATGPDSGAGTAGDARAGTVALIGRHGIDTICMGGGSATVNPPYQVSIAEGLEAAIGDRLLVVDGVEVRDRAVVAEPSAITDPETGEPGLRVAYLDAEGVVMASEHSSVASIVTGWDDVLPRPTEQVVLTARLTGSGPVRLGVLGTGTWTIDLDGERVGSAELVAEGFDPGESMLKPPVWTIDTDATTTTDDEGTREGALVTATVTVVRSEPQPGPDGKLSTLSHVIASGMGMKGLVVSPVPAPASEVLESVTAAAASADVAVVVVGLTEEQETEATDKSTLALLGDQDAMVSAVAAAASRTVVVVNASTPVLMPWFDEVDAVLVVGLPGQEGGHAVADALLGVREPAGRLVTSWPSADEAAPAWEVVPDGLTLEYTDGTFVGYRGFAAGHAPAPAHWLGAGDGYGAWTYGAARLLEGGSGAPSVEVTVANSSTHDSREVVQVYLRPDTEDQPVRLVGFAPVQVAAGSEATVTVDTDARLWRRWDEAANAWGEPLTGGTLLVARGLGDVQAELPLA